MALYLDVEKYQHYLDHSGMSEDEREDYLKAMWSIVVAFVDLGFDILPAESCGEPDDASLLDGLSEQELLEWPDAELNAVFEDAALAADMEGESPRV